MGKKIEKRATPGTASAGRATAAKSKRRKKPGKGVLYEVALTAKQNAAGDVEFKPKSKFWNNQKNAFRFSKDSADHPGMKDTDYHLVEFRLEDDQTNLNLRFPRDPEDAMWVVNSAKCPTEADDNEYDVARPLAVIDDHTLLALNLNRVQGQFGFRLNFVGTGSPDYVPWDPIGDNRDGGLR